MRVNLATPIFLLNHVSMPLLHPPRKALHMGIPPQLLEQAHPCQRRRVLFSNATTSNQPQPQLSHCRTILRLHSQVPYLCLLQEQHTASLRLPRQARPCARSTSKQPRRPHQCPHRCRMHHQLPLPLRGLLRLRYQRPNHLSRCLRRLPALQQTLVTHRDINKTFTLQSSLAINGPPIMRQ